MLRPSKIWTNNQSKIFILINKLQLVPFKHASVVDEKEYNIMLSAKQHDTAFP